MYPNIVLPGIEIFRIENNKLKGIFSLRIKYENSGTNITQRLTIKEASHT